MVRKSRQSVELNQQPLELSFQSLSVTVTKTGTKIVDGISGSARAGQMMALMGATGSGKTTLLSTLAHRNELGLRTSGSIRYGSEHRYAFCKALKSRVGFVEQDDIVIPELTVRQSLMFTAALRMGVSAGKSGQRARVEEVISELRLTKCADTLVGAAGARGISGGERKRLCIGTEVLTRPRLLFLDEPTSGLDSSTAEIVIKALKELATSSQVTVICSIHQPSSQIYHLFDRLLFLHNGKCVYNGPGGEPSVAAFAEAGMVCPLHYNPPDYFMGLAVGGTFDDVETRRRMQAALPHDDHAAMALAQHREDSVALHEPTSARYASYVSTQMQVISSRTWLKAKGQKLTLDSWLLYGSLAVITGLNWVGMGDEESDIRLRNGLTLWMVGTWMFFPLIAALTVLSPDRPLVLKELAVGAYRLSAYYVSTNAMVLPFDFLFSAYFTLIVYLMAYGKFLYFTQVLAIVLLNFLSIAMFYSIGILIAAGMPTRHLMVSTLCFITFCFAFAGFFVPYEEMEPWMQWTEHVNPMVYAYYIGLHITYSWGPTGFKCFEVDSGYGAVCDDGFISRNEVLELNGVSKSSGFCAGVMVAITFICHNLAYRLMRRDYTITVRVPDAADVDDKTPSTSFVELDDKSTFAPDTTVAITPTGEDGHTAATSTV